MCQLKLFLRTVARIVFTRFMKIHQNRVISVSVVTNLYLYQIIYLYQIMFYTSNVFYKFTIIL